MDVSLKRRVSESRRLLENPYAYIEYLESSKDEKRAGGPEPAVARRFSDDEIEAKATSLLTKLWVDRETLWSGNPPPDAIAIRDPFIGLRAVGYDTIEKAGMQYRTDSGAIEVAGVIDQSSKCVQISLQFPPHVRLFTVAHELGHAVLHPGMDGLHRDRPQDGTEDSRDPVEREADKFAACFLMPVKLVRAQFVARFGAPNFALSDESAFALAGKSLDAVRTKIRGRRDCARLLAGAQRFGGRHFVSLAEYFGVSVGAMAIRIEELDLVCL